MLEELEAVADDETGEPAALAPPAESAGRALPVTVYSWEQAADSNATAKPISPTERFFSKKRMNLFRNNPDIP